MTVVIRILGRDVLEHILRRVGKALCHQPDRPKPLTADYSEQHLKEGFEKRQPQATKHSMHEIAHNVGRLSCRYLSAISKSLCLTARLPFLLVGFTLATAILVIVEHAITHRILLLATSRGVLVVAVPRF